MSAIVTGIVKKTPAARCGIKAGDELISVNGHKISNVPDYMYYSAEPVIRVVLKREGRFIMLKINKGEYDPLGLDFESYYMDQQKTCCNKCIFCFKDQIPRGLRKSLYVKDDDARLSFLRGSYITLTNMNDEDIDRIIELKLKINVSVHTTNPELRCTMMNNSSAGEKLKYLTRLAEAGITMNCRIVLCPGINDGEELRRTLTDLWRLMPSVYSISVVPANLTRYRQGLHPLREFTAEECSEVIDLIGEFQRSFLEEYGARIVFPSDEFFLRSGRPLPGEYYYEDYPQFENGVGTLRSLISEFNNALETAPTPRHPREVSIATGSLAYESIRSLCDAACKKFEGIVCHVYEIKNLFLGESITATGLLTAGDIISQLKGKPLGSELLLSECMIMRDSDVFIDDVHIPDVEKALKIRVRVVGNYGGDMLNAIIGR